MTGSKIFSYLCLSFMAGVFIDSAIKIPILLFIWISVLGIIFISLFWQRNKKAVFLGFILIFCCLGVWRHQSKIPSISGVDLLPYQDKEVSIQGVVVSEPDYGVKTKTFFIDSQKISLNNNEKDVKGRISIIVSKSVPVLAGDIIILSGKLKEPVDFEGFKYKEYLAEQGVFYQILYPVSFLKTGRVSGFSAYFFEKMSAFKQKVKDAIARDVPYPESSILEATLLGGDGQMSQELKNNFNNSGLRHVVAVSGFHITILSAILMSFFLGLGISKNRAFYLAIAAIIFYTILVGLQPSAVRASIMGGILLLGEKTGRIYYSFRAIIFAAASMVFQNPSLILSDTGFQLSFLAMAGIIFLDPILKMFFKKIPASDFLGMGGMLSSTLAAQIFTLPILAYNFGRISLSAPLANLFMLPVAPFMMICGIIFVVVALILPAVSFIFATPCYFLFGYFLKISDIFSKPWMSKNIGSLSWLWPIIFYLVLVFFIWFIRRRWKAKFLDYAY
jgi:competence protein ComEC